MKKLALVVVLAVVASKLLHTAHETHVTMLPERVVTARPALAPVPPRPPAKPARHKAERVATKRPIKETVTTPAVVPQWFPKTEAEEEAAARTNPDGIRVVVGRLSASEDRALVDVRKIVEKDVHDWLAADVPTSWNPPAPAYDRMILSTYIQPVTRSFKPAPGEAVPAGPKAETAEFDDVYTLYRAGQKLDFSPARRAEVVDQYRREVAKKRMWELGAGIGFALASLLVLSSYIKTDEATKGYYTNRLRVLALAGLGGAGAVAYRFLS